MASNTPEIPTTGKIPEPQMPSPDEFQHSEGTYTHPEVTRRRIEVLLFDFHVGYLDRVNLILLLFF